jgi:hypothetical protein
LPLAATGAAPNFCGYTGTDVIQWGTVPNFGGATNNNATAFDTSYVGHLNSDGSTFSSANLSPVTRITDSISLPGTPNTNFTAGMGGSGVFTLTNTNSTLVRMDRSGYGLVCVFNPSGANQGHCGAPPNGWSGTAPTSGIFITTGQNSNGSCTSNCPANDFGPLSFSLTDPTVLYTFGNDTYDISSATTVTPYTINPATGSYSVGAALADFQYGIPAGNNAVNWTTSTSYPYGTYVTHILTSAEMASGGAWTATHTYNAGDIISGGGTANCMYRATIGGTSGSGPSQPAGFITAGNQSNCRTNAVLDNGMTWRGTNSAPQFIYQNTTSACVPVCISSSSTFQWVASPTTLATDGTMTSGSAVLTTVSSTPFTPSMVGQAVSVTNAGTSGAVLYTTILSYTGSNSVTLAIPALHNTGTGGATATLTGHPDFFSSTVGDSNGIVWTNVGPSYVPQNKNQLWQAIGGVSKDTLYGGKASKYALAISTNSYGTGGDYGNYEADQGTGFWALMYDQTLNVYHLLNAATGIWTDWSCSAGGSGYNCSGGAWGGTAVGAATAITNPLGTGQTCPFYIHNVKMSTNGLYILVVQQKPYLYPACASLESFYLWQTTPSSFNAANSLQITYGGMNHWAIGTNKLVAYNGQPFGYTAGVFTSIYNASDVSEQPNFSVSLKPLGNAGAGIPQIVPPGCYVTAAGPTIESPGCNLNEVLDSHLSMAGDPGTDTYPACGTSYNYATLGPAFNAWQNMETCYQTSPTYPSSSLPLTTGNVWQFTHTFATGTNLNFPTQFQISEYSQDANWLFWSSDWDCQTGSTSGMIPVVSSSGLLGQLPGTPVPASPTSICGLPWQPSTTYTTGNMIDPIEGTGGSGAVDDVFQAIAVNGTGTSGPNSSLFGDQPECGTVSCFASANPPGATQLATNGAMSAGSTVLTSSKNPFTSGQVGQEISVSGAGNAAGTIPLYTTIISYQSAGQVTLSAPTVETGGTTIATVNLVTSAGDTVCDSSNPSVSPDVINPSLPYSTSCPNGVVWQNVGPQTQRGDVFAVNLGNQH